MGPRLSFGVALEKFASWPLNFACSLSGLWRTWFTRKSIFMSCSKINLWWNIGRTLLLTPLKTRRNPFIRIVFCSNLQAHPYLPHFASQFEEICLIYLALLSANGYHFYESEQDVFYTRFNSVSLSIPLHFDFFYSIHTLSLCICNFPSFPCSASIYT